MVAPRRTDRMPEVVAFEHDILEVVDLTDDSSLAFNL